MQRCSHSEWWASETYENIYNNAAKSIFPQATVLMCYFHVLVNLKNQSFNRTLKREFFKRRRLSVFGCLTKLEEVIKYYSSIHIIFHSLPKYQERLQKLSFYYTTESFIKTNKYTYEVCSRYLIKLKNNSCSCWYFSKWGICKHAMAFSNVYDLS